MNNSLFLSNTDTTIGFISQNKERLDAIKQRPSHKKYITALNSLKSLKKFARVPQKYKNRIRKSQKTTFIFPNKHSYRVIKDKKHLLLLNRLQWAYTTSANLSGKGYDEVFAKKHADIIIEPLHYSGKSSTIYKINTKTIKKIR